MSGAGSWFYVWVPSKEHERSARSRTRSDVNDDYLGILKSGDHNTQSSCNKQYSRETSCTNGLPAIQEVSLPAIQEDTTIDLFTPPHQVPPQTTDDTVTTILFEADLSGSRKSSPISQDQSSTSEQALTPETTNKQALPLYINSQEALSPDRNIKTKEVLTAETNTKEALPANISAKEENAEDKDIKDDISECSPTRTFDASEADVLLLSKSQENSSLNCPLATKEVLEDDTEDETDNNEDENEDDQNITDPAKDKLNETKAFDKSTMSFLDWEPMEEICKKLLNRMNINTVSIQKSTNKAKVLFLFFVPYEFIETVLLEFQNQGIGSTGESTLSVVPASIHYSDQPSPSIQKNEFEAVKMDSFYSSVKSRLLVAEVFARIQAGADFSFDYLLLLVLAGIIAFMGLIENSSVILVASMLVSPLMGPILAGIFGGVIQDPGLTRKGIVHESISLFICIAIGLLFGLLISPIAEVYGCPQWPTKEMLSRGEARALWVGVLIAVPSGAGVALSVLGGNAGSLVGVAISASLLPPAVNCGIFWAIALCISILGENSFAAFHGFGEELDPETNITTSLYEHRYSENFALEAFLLGLISLLLTLINILCIIFTGVAILRLKEVTPEKIPQKFSNFWRRDIKAHRNYYKTLTKEDNEKLLSELQAMGLSKKPSEGLEGTFLQSMFERASQDSDLINIKDWVSMPPATVPPKSAYRIPAFRIFSGDESQELLPSEITEKMTAPVDRRRRDRSLSPYNPYATFHGRHNLNSFVDMSNFFHSELRRSRDFRRRLYTTESHASYVP